MKTKSTRLAFCGVIAALSTAVLFLTGVVPAATIALPALAGCFVIGAVAEIDVAHGFAVYGAVSVLSALLVPDREAALIYLLFFGYYPALYAVLQRLQNKVLRYAVKLVIFNAAAVAETLLCVYLLGIPWSDQIPGGALVAVLLLVLANVVFVLYDFCMNGLILFYVRRIHPFVRKYMK